MHAPGAWGSTLLAQDTAKGITCGGLGRRGHLGTVGLAFRNLSNGARNATCRRRARCRGLSTLPPHRELSSWCSTHLQPPARGDSCGFSLFDHDLVPVQRVCRAESPFNYAEATTGAVLPRLPSRFPNRTLWGGAAYRGPWLRSTVVGGWRAPGTAGCRHCRGSGGPAGGAGSHGPSPLAQ